MKYKLKKDNIITLASNKYYVKDMLKKDNEF